MPKSLQFAHEAPDMLPIQGDHVSRTNSAKNSQENPAAYTFKILTGKLMGRNERRAQRRVFAGCLAEEEGFEPSVVLPLRLISSQVHSTTLPPLRIRFRLSKAVFYQARKVSKPPI